MISFKEYLTEKAIKPYTFKNLKLEKAMKLLNEHCTEALQTITRPLWRGMSNHKEEIIMIDAASGVRKSQNTTNYYTELMDHAPSLAEFPKRSKSLICSTSKNYADNYIRLGTHRGERYAIFPYDGTKIAVCPRFDMWETELKIPGVRHYKFEEADDFNVFLQRYLKMPVEFSEMEKYVKTKQFAELFDREFGANKPKIAPTEFLDALLETFNPKRTGFRLMSITEFANTKLRPNANDGNECWVSGKVIAIREDLYEEFLKAWKEQK